jgi:hypothetical protein
LYAVFPVGFERITDEGIVLFWVGIEKYRISSILWGPVWDFSRLVSGHHGKTGISWHSIYKFQVAPFSSQDFLRRYRELRAWIQSDEPERVSLGRIILAENNPLAFCLWRD